MSDLLKVPGKFYCPACRREIYTRRRKTCEFCGAPLPEAVRLSPDEIDSVDDEIEAIRQRRERDREKAEEERRRQGSGSADAGV